jgi:hypothetical protein
MLQRAILMPKSKSEMVLCIIRLSSVYKLLTFVAATSNDSWGPVGSDMAEIAQLTFAEYVYSLSSVFTVQVNILKYGYVL